LRDLPRAAAHPDAEPVAARPRTLRRPLRSVRARTAERRLAPARRSTARTRVRRRSLMATRTRRRERDRSILRLTRTRVAQRRRPLRSVVEASRTGTSSVTPEMLRLEGTLDDLM
jgi:hypothetical protein